MDWFLFRHESVHGEDFRFKFYPMASFEVEECADALERDGLRGVKVLIIPIVFSIFKTN